MNVEKTREALQEWTSLWREKKSGVELQTCLHNTAEVADFCPELGDGTGGHCTYFYSAVIIKSSYEMNVFNMASGQGFMECKILVLRT